MADAVQTFKSVCRGGLNTGSDVLSLGEETPGAARQLVNYEPNLEGGYRRLSGFANNYGTVGINGNAGTGSVLGVCIANGINNGVFAARKPTSGSNYLHRWDATNSVWVAITSDLIVNDRDGVSASASVSAGNNVVIGGALASSGAVNFTTGASEQPRQVTIFGGGNESTKTFTITGTDYLDADQVEAVTGPNNSTVSSTKFFNTVTKIEISIPLQVIVKAGGDESGKTFTVTGTNTLNQVITEEVTGPNNGTTTSLLSFKTVTQIAVDAATAGDVEVGTSGDDNGISVAATASEAGNLTLGGALASSGVVSFAVATTAAIEVGSGTGQYRPNNPTMNLVTKVRFEKINFGVPKIVLTDGINPAATYDGTTYVQITDTNAPTDPTISAEFQNHLFLAGDPDEVSNLYFSAPTAETDFSPANGGGVINVGFEIVAIKKFRNVLYIFGSNNIKRLVGENSANFRLETVTSNLGCLATDSVVELGGDLLFLSPDGIRPIGGTNKIGDVNLETISKNIQSQVNNTINNETLTTLSSVIIRNKSQFRYMFSTSGSTGIIGALREYKGNFAYEFGTLFGVEGTCADSGYIGQTEIVIHGAANGKVYQQESGTNFDTSNILSIYKTPYIYMEDPQKRKLYYDAATYMTAEGAFNLSVGVSYDYDNTDILMPDNTTIVNTDPAAYYNTGTNIATYDSADIYDGNPAPVEGASFSGSGKAISLTYVTDDTNASHSIQGFTVTYGLGDVR